MTTSHPPRRCKMRGSKRRKVRSAQKFHDKSANLALFYRMDIPVFAPDGRKLYSSCNRSDFRNPPISRNPSHLPRQTRVVANPRITVEGPFGEVVKKTGVTSSMQFGFSTKYKDDETGLLYYGYRYYQPTLGRWGNRDLLGDEAFFRTFIQYKPSEVYQKTRLQALLPLYRFARNTAVSWFDALGLFEVDTGVAICDGYIKGDLIFGIFSSHTFLKCGGKGFGLYANSHISGGCSCKAVYDDGVIKDDDLDVYPESKTPEKGKPYSKCTSVKLDPCKYNINQFKKCVCAFNQPNYNPGYMIDGWNCGDFANNAISHCKQQAEIKK